jgi:hypothetical protein
MANTIKKESEVTKVTTLADEDNVRVTLANGQSGSIKKSDLMPIIKDELGKLLGNADALSTFTNVLVNNGQTLGKATIENLTSVVSEGSIKYKSVDLNNWFVKFELIVGRHSNLPEGEVGTCVAICIEEIPNDYYIQFLFSSNLHYREIRKYGYVTNWRTL